MSNTNVTITTDPANSASPVFFRIFDSEKVRPSLTDKESNTYKSTIHFDTQSVRAWQREIFHN
jgi:hypothetical protein